MMTILKLFWSFIKIGFTSFGGLSMIPLITDEVISNGWMNSSEVSDIVAIAEMTPGPLGLNCATFAGMKAAGILGAVAANLGILMPTFTLCLAAAVFFERFKEGTFIKRIMVGIRPACLGLVFGVAVALCGTNYINANGIDYISIGIGGLDMLLLLKFKLDIPKIIIISAALGILFYGVFKFAMI